MNRIALRSILFATALAFVAGCKDDVTKEKAAWDMATRDFANQFDVAKKALTDLDARVKGLQVPADFAPGAAQKAALEGALKAADAAVKGVEGALASAKTSVDTAFAAGKREAVVAATEAAKTAISPALVKATEALGSATRQLTELDQAISDAKAAADKAKAEADALAALVTETTHKKGATVDFAGVTFKAGAAELDADASKAELTKLVAFYKGCEDLKAGLAATLVSTEKDAKAVAAKRAEAVKAWLVANGVGEKLVGKAEGVVAKEGADKVTFTVEAACK